MFVLNPFQLFIMFFYTGAFFRVNDHDTSIIQKLSSLLAFVI